MRRGIFLSLLLGGCSLYFGAGDGRTETDAGSSVVPDAVDVPVDAADAIDAGDVVPVPSCALTLPNDRWIVFDSDRDQFNRDIYKIRPDGTQLQRLTMETSIDMDPAPSPDGSTVAFASNRSGTMQIHLLDLTTNTVTQLTHHAGGAEEPSFSRSGTLVAFRSGSSVYTIHADGTNEAFVADSGIGVFNAYFSPQFSSDDSELIFDRNNEIDAVHLDGSGFRYIVKNWTTRIKGPSVSPAGLAVAYDTYCDVEGHSIWITPSQVATEPCGGRRITPSEASTDSHRAAWGPDNLLAYERINSSNASTLALIATEPNSTPCKVTSDPYDNRNPAWLIRP